MHLVASDRYDDGSPHKQENLENYLFWKMKSDWVLNSAVRSHHCSTGNLRIR